MKRYTLEYTSKESFIQINEVLKFLQELELSGVGENEPIFWQTGTTPTTINIVRKNALAAQSFFTICNSI